MKRILIDIGSHSAGVIPKIAHENGDKIILATRRKIDKKFAPDFRVYNYQYPDLCFGINHPEEDFSDFKIENFWEIISLPETVQIIERNTFGFRRSQTIPEMHWTAFQVFTRARTFFLMNKISKYFLMSTPHNYFTWIYAQVAQQMGVEVFYLQQGLVPWRLALTRGLKRNPELVPPRKIASSPAEPQEYDRYTSMKRNGTTALPFYERERRPKKLSNLSAIKKIFEVNRIDRAIVNTKNYLEMVSMYSPVEKAGRYAVFFLHFQPERTTLPDGWGFTQQLIAIKTLRRGLPSDIVLYVKEHPSTFFARYKTASRSRYFYTELNKIDGVKIVDVNYDTYDLMKSSEIIATVTGTVAWEAILLRKPSIVFGRGIFGPHPTEIPHRFESLEKLVSFIHKVLNAQTSERIEMIARCEREVLDFEAKNYYLALEAGRKYENSKDFHQSVSFSGARSMLNDLVNLHCE